MRPSGKNTKFVIYIISTQAYTYQGRPQDLAGGGGAKNFFFRFGNLHVAKQHAAHGEAMRFVRGVHIHIKE